MTLAVTLSVEDLAELVSKAVAAELAKVALREPREVLTLEQCAELLERTTKNVMKLVREEGLPAHYISEREPRFRRSEVYAWLATRPGRPKETET